MNDWNRILMLRRLRGPAMLLLTGVIALLDQLGILTWGHAWPLYLILLGVIALAERAALATLPPYGDPYGAPTGYPYGYPPTGQPPPAPGAPAWTQNAAEGSEPAESTGLVPVSPFTSLAANSAEPHPDEEEQRKESHS